MWMHSASDFVSFDMCVVNMSAWCVVDCDFYRLCEGFLVQVSSEQGASGDNCAHDQRGVLVVRA